MIKRKNWRWRGVPGHFICADRCAFRLSTEIGVYRVSTVGAFYAQPGVSSSMTMIGSDRHYETMVFRLNANGVPEYGEDVACEGFRHTGDPNESDKRAEEMHERICLTYARLQ